MEDFEDDFLDDILDEIDDDWDRDTTEFLSKRNIYELHLWTHKRTILQHLVEGDVEISNTVAHEYVQHIRADLVHNATLMIQYHIEEENYELVGQIKKHTEMLIEQTVQLKTKLERFL